MVGSLLLSCCGVLCGCKDSENNAQSGKKNYRIVVLAPLTGPGASLGTFMKHGIEIARKDIASYSNATFTIEVLDSKNHPQEGVSVLRQALLKGKPDVLISSQSSVTKAILPIVTKEKIFTVATTTSLSGLPQEGPTLVRVFPNSYDFVAPSVKLVASKYNRIALLYVQDEFGESNRKEAVKILSNMDRQFVRQDAFALLSTDVRETIQRTLSCNPEAIFVTGYGPAFSAVFRQLAVSAPGVPVFTDPGFTNPAVLDLLGEAASGITFLGTLLDYDAPANSLRDAFRNRYVATFDKKSYYLVAGCTYDSILWSAQILAEKGYVAKDDWVARAPFEGVIGTIGFNQDGECSISLVTLMNKDGKNIEVK